MALTFEKGTLAESMFMASHPFEKNDWNFLPLSYAWIERERSVNSVGRRNQIACQWKWESFDGIFDEEKRIIPFTHEQLY